MSVIKVKSEKSHGKQYVIDMNASSIVGEGSFGKVRPVVRGPDIKGEQAFVAKVIPKVKPADIAAEVEKHFYHKMHGGMSAAAMVFERKRITQQLLAKKIKQSMQGYG